MYIKINLHKIPLLKSYILQMLIFIFVLLLFFPSCKEQPQVVEQLRAIKTYTVSEMPTGKERKFSGIVYSTDYSYLSFEVVGNVVAVNVDIGDRVTKGQVLAVLDKEPYELDVQGAEAELVKAEANLVHKKSVYEREAEAFKTGAISKNRMESNLFGYNAAKSQIEYATSKLNLARRNLRKTVLKAPFHGYIASREVEPYMEVKAGQRLFEIDAEGSLEVRADIPETVINFMSVGDQVNVAFTTVPGKMTKGRISYIGTAAGTANAFPIKVQLINPPQNINPGMTAELTFFFKAKKDQLTVKAYLVPLHAILAGEEPRQGYVFIYNHETSTVKKTLVRSSGVQNNMSMVYEGVSAGDIIAAAGVSFLSDGQKVRLVESD
jgi:multidrug efflux system membrane fusion protein